MRTWIVGLVSWAIFVVLTDWVLSSLGVTYYSVWQYLVVRFLLGVAGAGLIWFGYELGRPKKGSLETGPARNSPEPHP